MSRLVWDGCVNVRDLGGHPTEDGLETRSGAVVRADSVRRLSDAGWAALVEYGVRTIVDLRTGGELADDPPVELPVDVVHVPVFPEAGDPIWAEIDALADRPQEYLALLEWGAQRFAQAVAAVGHADRGAVVVHCQVGKDRTGLVSALLLRLAGVGIDYVAADYAISERNLDALIERWLAEAADEAERQRVLHLGRTPASVMAEVLRELERRYGNVRAYLRAGGATDAALDGARDRLRG